MRTHASRIESKRHDMMCYIIIIFIIIVLLHYYIIIVLDKIMSEVTNYSIIIIINYNRIDTSHSHFRLNEILNIECSHFQDFWKKQNAIY